MIVDLSDNFSLQELDNTYLWRYMELSKLIDLLINRTIYFARLDKFEDGLEGITGKNVGLKYFSLSTPITKGNINKTFDKPTQEKIIKGDELRRQEYMTSLSDSQQTQFASCWYLGDRESLAMWKLYSDRDGVAIKFKAIELADTLIAAAESYTNSDFRQFFLGPVVYKNIWPFDMHETFDGKFNALKKDKSYIHESEFRFVSAINLEAKGNHDHLNLSIGDLSTYDLEIISNPFMSKYKAANLKKLLAKYNLKDTLRPSQIEIRKNSG